MSSLRISTSNTHASSQRPPSSAIGSFILPSPISSASSNPDDDSPLPFPTALPRSDFLAPDFDPAAYLSALGPNRHQTLDDLRSDLRERSASIAAELLELVNDNYTAFLSLGDDLRGGGDRVEDARVALLGFRRAVEEIRGRVASRGRAVEELNNELADVRSQIELGRKMLELDERLSDLEERLAVESAVNGTNKSHDDDDESDWASDGEDVNGVRLSGSNPRKLAALARDLLIIDGLADAVGRDIPFVIKSEARMIRCRNTLLLDVGNALKEAKSAGPRAQGRIMEYLGIYRRLGAGGEAVKVLKGT